MPTPPRTSVRDIVDAARQVVEEDGLEGLRMKRVAATVGVRAPSLYKHVRNRGDLIRLVTEDVARRLAALVTGATGSGDPAQDLRAIGRAFRAFAHANPAAYGLVFGPMPDEWRAAPETLVTTTEALIRATAALAGPTHALDAARTMVAWAHGFVSMELAGAFRMGGDVDAAFEFGIKRMVDALSTESTPAISIPH